MPTQLDSGSAELSVNDDGDVVDKSQFSYEADSSMADAGFFDDAMTVGNGHSIEVTNGEVTQFDDSAEYNGNHIGDVAPGELKFIDAIGNPVLTKDITQDDFIVLPGGDVTPVGAALQSGTLVVDPQTGFYKLAGVENQSSSPNDESATPVIPEAQHFETSLHEAAYAVLASDLSSDHFDSLMQHIAMGDADVVNAESSLIENIAEASGKPADHLIDMVKNVALGFHAQADKLCRDNDVTLDDFQEYLDDLPDQDRVFHAVQNHFYTRNPHAWRELLDEYKQQLELG